MMAKGQAPLPAARLQQMRGLTLDCIAKHMHQAATFFASKLCSMSDQHPDDVYLLAQVCLLGAVTDSARPGASHVPTDAPPLLGFEMMCAPATNFV